MPRRCAKSLAKAQSHRSNGGCLAALQPDAREHSGLLHWAHTPRCAHAKEWPCCRPISKLWARHRMPVFVTVDALLRCHAKGKDQVPLIQRAHGPARLGHARRLSGAARQPVAISACASFGERNPLPLARPTCWPPCAVQVFDHPIGPARAYHYPCALSGPGRAAQSATPVQGADDAALARWVPIADLAQMEGEFFEDHFQILCQFRPSPWRTSQRGNWPEAENIKTIATSATRKAIEALYINFYESTEHSPRYRAGHRPHPAL